MLAQRPVSPYLGHEKEGTGAGILRSTCLLSSLKINLFIGVYFRQQKMYLLEMSKLHKCYHNWSSEYSHQPSDPFAPSSHRRSTQPLALFLCRSDTLDIFLCLWSVVFDLASFMKRGFSTFLYHPCLSQFKEGFSFNVS